MTIIRIVRVAIIFSFVSFSLQACGTVPPPAPIATPMTNATATALATSTHTSTATATLLPTRSPIPTQSLKPTFSLRPTDRPCEIPNGIWKSDETDIVWPMIYPMPTVFFKIQFCMLRELEIYVNVNNNMGFSYIDTEVNSMLQFGSDKQPFFSLSFDNPDGPGSVSVYGKFTPPDKCLGFIMFSDGFSSGGDPLTEPVTIAYHAKPVK
jgi:hypothetical protein